MPSGERLAIASGAEPADPTDENRMALACYARAMDHVGVMAADEDFEWVERVVLDLHFDACYFQKDRDPGQYRRSGIEVTSPDGGLPAYVGPPADAVRPLMAEVIHWCGVGDPDAHLVVRAAMAHLHVVSVHPFRDGNGRISRIVQSLVLALSGLLAPEFVSIEEYLGEHTAAYYAALREVQDGSHQPQRDATPIRTLVRGGAPGPGAASPAPARAGGREVELSRAPRPGPELAGSTGNRAGAESFRRHRPRELFSRGGRIRSYGQQRSAPPARRWTDHTAGERADDQIQRKRAPCSTMSADHTRPARTTDSGRGQVATGLEDRKLTAYHRKPHQKATRTVRPDRPDNKKPVFAGVLLA